MALKIKFLDGTSEELTDDEMASVNRRLDQVLPPNFGKGRVSRMVADSIELSRLGEALGRGTFSRAEKKSVENDFYALTKKIREDSQSFWREKKMAAAGLDAGEGQDAKGLGTQASAEANPQPLAPRESSAKSGQLKYTKFDRVTDSGQVFDTSRSLAGKALILTAGRSLAPFMQNETASSPSVVQSRLGEKFGASTHEDGEKQTPKRKRSRDNGSSMGGPS